MTDLFPRYSLTPDYSISRVIKGHWQLSDDHLRQGSIGEQDALDDMCKFVEAGITTFDVADIYTGAEELIGQFMATARGSLPPVQIHTKYVPDLTRLATLKEADTREIIERSLTRLRVERLDLVQFHWWDLSIDRYVETANHLKTLQHEGKIRNIGVTNFNAAALKRIVDSGVNVVSAQVQYSVLDRRPERGFYNFCKDNGVTMLCYGSLAGGFLGEKYLGLPEPQEDLQSLENRSLTKYRLIVEEFGGWDAYQDLLSCLDSIAQKHGLTIGEVAIAFTQSRPGVGAAIVGAHNSKHLDRLRTLGRVSLDVIDFNPLESFLQSHPGPPGDVYELERNSETHKGVMKYNLNKGVA